MKRAGIILLSIIVLGTSSIGIAKEIKREHSGKGRVKTEKKEPSSVMEVISNWFSNLGRPKGRETEENIKANQDRIEEQQRGRVQQGKTEEAIEKAKQKSKKDE